MADTGPDLNQSGSNGLEQKRSVYFKLWSVYFGFSSVHISISVCIIIFYEWQLVDCIFLDIFSVLGRRSQKGSFDHLWLAFLRQSRPLWRPPLGHLKGFRCRWLSSWQYLPAPFQTQNRGVQKQPHSFIKSFGYSARNWKFATRKLSSKSVSNY